MKPETALFWLNPDFHGWSMLKEYREEMERRMRAHPAFYPLLRWGKVETAVPCFYPENEGLTLSPCPRCGSSNVREFGDDFDGDVGCEDCDLTCPTCNGTHSAVAYWNACVKDGRWKE